MRFVDDHDSEQVGFQRHASRDSESREYYVREVFRTHKVYLVDQSVKRNKDWEVWVSGQFYKAIHEGLTDVEKTILVLCHHLFTLTMTINNPEFEIGPLKAGMIRDIERRSTGKLTVSISRAH